MRRLLDRRRTVAQRAIQSKVVQMSTDGVLVADLLDPDQPLRYVNHAFEEITGYSARDAVGKNCRYLQGSERSQPEIATMRAAIERREPVSVTLRNYRKDGTLFWNALRLAPVLDAHGKATHYVGLMRDVTDLMEATARLDRALGHDLLTGVANRESFSRHIEGLLRASDSGFVVVANVDLAGFHEINTNFGHDVGDLLLCQVGERLLHLPRVFVARTGPDVFAIARTLASPDDADTFIEEVRGVLARRFAVPGAIVDARFSIGFTVGKTGGNTGDAVTTLMREAGVALHESKSSYLRGTRRYDTAMDARLKTRSRLTCELQQAIAQGDFVLQFQPRVVLENAAIVGAEALIRWRHPVFGLQPPSRFIPISEETGLILELGEWVLRGVAAFARSINQGRDEPLTFSANVSQIEFEHADMPRLLRSVIDESGIDPAWLTLELTESLFAEGRPEMVSALRGIRGMGVGVSIDDFGTGYSSLQYLQKFPISEIKVDRGFVTNLRENRFNRVVVESIIRIAGELRASVTAEGVETEAERAALQGCGCLFGQGFLFGRPMAADDFARIARPDPATLVHAGNV